MSAIGEPPPTDLRESAHRLLQAVDALAAEFAEAQAQAKRLRNGLEAAIEGLDLAARVHEAIEFEDDKDEAIKLRAVATMRLALDHARNMLDLADQGQSSEAG